MPDIHSSVMPALRLRGSLKAGMPFEIASTPVSAVVPLENACSSRNSVTPPTCAASCSGGGSTTAPSEPMNCRKKVGTATTRPDSRTPRRLITITRPTSATAIPTRYGSSPGNAETSCATPEDIDTATVRM